jgi:hypothetical protein
MLVGVTRMPSNTGQTPAKHPQVPPNTSKLTIKPTTTSRHAGVGNLKQQGNTIHHTSQVASACVQVKPPVSCSKWQTLWRRPVGAAYTPTPTSVTNMCGTSLLNPQCCKACSTPPLLPSIPLHLPANPIARSPLTHPSTTQVSATEGSATSLIHTAQVAATEGSATRSLIHTVTCPAQVDRPVQAARMAVRLSRVSCRSGKDGTTAVRPATPTTITMRQPTAVQAHRCGHL